MQGSSYQIAKQALENKVEEWFNHHREVTCASPLLYQKNPTIHIGVKEKIVSTIPDFVIYVDFETNVRSVIKVVQEVVGTCH